MELGQRTNKVKNGVLVISGIVMGMLLTIIIMVTVMPKMMIVVEKSRLDFDNTVLAIEKAIDKNRWASPGTLSMNRAMAKHGIKFSPKVSLINLCNAEYAKSVLETDRYISCMMPCTIAVWENDAGKVFISKMNMTLMANLFGGNIKKVMGGDVAKDEKKILEGIIN